MHRSSRSRYLLERAAGTPPGTGGGSGVECFPDQQMQDGVAGEGVNRQRIDCCDGSL